MKQLFQQFQNQKGFAIIPLIVILALAGIGVYWFTSGRTIPGVSWLMPTPDPTAGWQTYRNEQYGFEVKYPEGWQINENNSPLTSQWVQVFLNSNQLQSQKEPQVLDDFEIKVSKEYKPGWENYFFDHSSNGEITINNVYWKTFLLPTGTGGDAASGQTFLPVFGLQSVHNNSLFSIKFFNQTNLTSLQNQILATFKFIK
ncbi:MAG: hypothetical protein HYX21_02270 [Candidatus Yanofskybacteria bacterium]|nr:hypothetical protein [Candidatus Yanofskybacteria bacterium]